MTALASHQCDFGSFPGLGVIRRVEFVVGSCTSPWRFSTDFPVFFFPQTQHYNSISMSKLFIASSSELSRVSWVNKNSIYSFEKLQFLRLNLFSL